jgi:multicomponent Na+:H+ antiporter subunit E
MYMTKDIPEDDRIRVKRSASAPTAGRTSRWGAVWPLVLRFAILFGLWVLLSGMFDAFHLSLGVAASIFVTWISAEFFPTGMSTIFHPAAAIRMFLYIVWLLWKIFVANIAMLRLVFHPRMGELLDPNMLQFKTGLRSKLALTTLANSITLTPGTITVIIDERGYVTVHAIDASSGVEDFLEMERRIALVYGEA